MPIIVSGEFTGSSLIRDNNLGYVGSNLMDYCDFTFDVLGNRKGNLEERSNWVKENLTWEKFCGGMVKIFKEVV